MALDSLPVELIHSIVAYLEPKDLYPLRLVCRRLCAIASSRVMKTLAFCLCKSDLEVLNGIATCTNYPGGHGAAEHVTSLIYFAEMLSSKRHDFAAYARAVECYRFTDAELRDHFDIYKRLFAEQQEIVSQNPDFPILEQLIAKLPNLEEIQVTSSPGWAGTWEPPEEIYEQDGWHVRKSWPFRRNMIQHTDIISGCGVEQADGPSRHVRALLRGIHKAGTLKLRTIRLRGMQHSFFDRKPQFGGGLADITTPLLANVTFFELSVDALAPWDCDGEMYQTEGDGDLRDRYTLRPHLLANGSICKTTMRQGGVLRTALLGMPNLTTLRLVIFGCIPYWKLTNGICNPPCLEDMIDPQQSWPNLQSLTLEGIYCQQEQLVHIIVAAKSSLVKLELNRIRLLNGSWPKLLPQLKDGLEGRRVDVSLEGDVVMLQDWPDDTGPRWSREWDIKGGSHGAAIRNYFNDPAVQEVPLEDGLRARSRWTFSDFDDSSSDND